MAIKQTIKSIDKLRAELGQIEARRRQIFEILRDDPENIILYTEQTLNSMIQNKTWFEKITTKGSVFAQLSSFKVTTKNTSHLVNSRKPIVEANLSWNQYSEQTSVVSIIESKVSISAFNEIEPQILNGFKRTSLTEKEIKIKTLDLKEKFLLEQIKQIKEERKKIK